MRIGILGPVEATVRDAPVPLGRRRERLLLAVLALDVSRWISVDALADAVFGGDGGPDGQRTKLKVGISRLRAALAPFGPVIRARGGGQAYMLDVPPRWVDAEEFRLLAREGLTTRDPAQRARILDQALALWRGPLLQDAADVRDRLRLGDDLDVLRTQAVEQRWAAEIDCHRYAEAIVALTPLVAAAPTNETLAGLLMMALHRSGRTADALGVYARTRRVVSDEFGVEPSPGLTDLHVRILRQEDEPAGPLAAADGPEGPDTLPRPIPDFAGRDHEIAELDGLLRRPGVPIVVLAGPGGIGKTALAVHWARLHPDTCPDGRLYVDLRGFSRGRPLSALAALTALLGALGVPAEGVPADEDAAAALLRGRLAARRALLVLDNAESAAQVRPLIPATDGCGVLVTSRHQLAGLTMSHSAVRLELGYLTDAESVAILRGVVGNGRVDAEPAAVAAVVELCAGLPLALRIAAAVLNMRTGLSFAEYAERVRADALAAIEITDDADAGLRAVFGYSYLSLGVPLREVFALLSTPAGADITAPAAVALTGLEPARVRAYLAELCDAHLLEQRRAGRYSMHSLVRAYAAEQRAALAADVATGARERLLGYYIHTADNASVAGADAKLKLPRDPVPAGVVPDGFADGPQARAWFQAEAGNLVAEAVHAAAAGPFPAAWQLADALHTYFWSHRDPVAWPAALEAGIAAALEAGAGAPLANMLVRRGNAHWVLAEPDAAEQVYAEALAVNESIGRRNGVAGVHESLAALYMETGRLTEALASARIAYEIYEELGRRDQQAFILAGMGVVAAEQDDPQAAVDYSLRAAGIHQELGMRQAYAAPMIIAARAYREMEPPDLAAAERTANLAWTAAAEAGSGFGMADARAVLAEILLAAGRPDEAEAYAEEAVAQARAAEYQVTLGYTLVARAEVRRCGGGDPAADYAEALAVAERTRHPHLQVRALMGLARSGPDGRAALDRAADIARRHGLKALLRKVIRLRAESGAPSTTE